MNTRAYEPMTASAGVAEDRNVLAGTPGVGARPLVCRWPRGRVPQGVVIFCHGLGSNGAEYADLSSHWAAHGYLVIHPTFRDAIGVVAAEEPGLGLDPKADLSRWAAMPEIRQRMHEILHSPERGRERVAVVGRILDLLPQIVAATAGNVDARLPVAVAGHSFGAYTAQLVAGAQVDLPDDPNRSFRDPRVAAAILLSAQGRDQQGLRDGSWDAMDGPVLTITGTLDRGAKGGDWHWKSEPFELAPAGSKYLAVLDNGDHFLGGLTSRDPQLHVPAQQAALRQLTLAFLDAHLCAGAAARGWLETVGERLGDCRLLFKRK